MTIGRIINLGLLMSLTLLSNYASAALTPEQKQEIQQVISDYLVSNPEVLEKASQALEKKQALAMEQQAKAAIKENQNQVFSSQLSTIGNPNAKVTLVEFFDYQCGSCKQMGAVLKNVMQKNNHLKIVYKEFPILGKNSELSSKAALAASLQGKYRQMHEALISAEGRLDEKTIFEKATAAGIDVNRLKKDMQSAEVNKALSENIALAKKMHLMGTPALVIASTPNGQYNNTEVVFIPGSTSEDSLQEYIQKVEKNG